MLINPISVSSGVIKTASIFTQMKGGFTTLSWLVILILLVIWIINKRKNKKRTANTV
jgi:lipoprotein signal peptidase